jgi:hypothetical protein
MSRSAGQVQYSHENADARMTFSGAPRIAPIPEDFFR